MDQYKDILIQRCLEKSDEALISAELNFNNNLLMTTLNRVYYAIFYTVSALGYKHGFVTSKHSKLMGWFNKKFIFEDKIFDKKLTKIYSDAYKLRQENDYQHMINPNKKDTENILSDAKIFIETVRKVISS